MNIPTIFANILNMSLTASYCIAAVLLLRLLLGGQPKILSYLLWGVVLFRLLCPVSFSSSLSLLRMDTALFSPIGMEASSGWGAPGQSDLFQAQTGRMQEIADAGAWKGQQTDEKDMTEMSYMTRSQKFFAAASWVWSVGAVMLGLYGIVTALLLKRSLRSAVYRAEGVYETEGMATPFVFGVLRPRIYLPARLGEREKKYVLAHERVHVARRDYLVKILAFAAVCVHWFNPLVWLAFHLLEKDMEMSCDEAVLQKLGADVKKEYSLTLLSLATERSSVGGCPLAFGEGKVKGRVRNILSYRKKTAAAVACAAVALIAVCAGLALNPSGASGKAAEVSEEERAFVENYATAFGGRDAAGIVGMYVDEETALANEFLMEKAGGTYTMGVSSPVPDEFRYEIIPGEHRALIQYYAWTSDPHAAVWKQEITYTRTEDGYRMTRSDLKFMDSIASREEYEEAYRINGQYQFIDYVESGFVEAVNYQRAHTKTGYAADNSVYEQPETAAAYIMNLTGGEASAQTASNGTATVQYAFADGSSVTIPMYNVNYRSETANSDAVHSEESASAAPDVGEADGDLWILDLAVWNAAAP